MTSVSAEQPPADDVMLTGDQAIDSRLLDEDQAKRIKQRMVALNDRWNALNTDVIEKEMRSAALSSF